MISAMAPAEKRRHLLGDDLIAEIQTRAEQAPPPSRELIARLRPILTRPVRAENPVTARARARAA